MFDILACPLSVSERFLLQPLVCGTAFHRTSLLPHLSPSSAVVLNHISSHFLIPLSDSSLICTVFAQWLVILDTIIVTIFCIIFNIYSTLVHLWAPLAYVQLVTVVIVTIYQQGKLRKMWIIWHEIVSESGIDGRFRPGEGGYTSRGVCPGKIMSRGLCPGFSEFTSAISVSINLNGN